MGVLDHGGGGDEREGRGNTFEGLVGGFRRCVGGRSMHVCIHGDDVLGCARRQLAIDCHGHEGQESLVMMDGKR